MRLTRSRSFWWSVAVTVAIAGLVAALVPATDWTALLEEFLEERNVFQAMVVFAAAYVAASLLLVPTWIFPIAAGAAFGFGRGLLAAVVSSAIGALCAYLLARHVIRDRVARAARKSDAFKAIDQAVRREPWMVVALLRLSPVLPSGLKSYFLGLTQVDWRSYIAASVAGMLPGLALKSWLGHIGRDALARGSPLGWLLLAGGIAATVAAAAIVGRMARRRLGL